MMRDLDGLVLYQSIGSLHANAMNWCYYATGFLYLLISTAGLEANRASDIILLPSHGVYMRHMLSSWWLVEPAELILIFQPLSINCRNCFVRWKFLMDSGWCLNGQLLQYDYTSLPLFLSHDSIRSTLRPTVQSIMLIFNQTFILLSHDSAVFPFLVLLVVGHECQCAHCRISSIRNYSYISIICVCSVDIWIKSVCLYCRIFKQQI